MPSSDDPLGGAQWRRGKKNRRGLPESSSGQRRLDSKKNRKPSTPPEATVSITPHGLDFFNRLLDAASAEAGRPISGDDLLEALRRVRAETGQSDPQFRDPAILACFKRHLRAIGGEHPL